MHFIVLSPVFTLKPKTSFLSFASLTCCTLSQYVCGRPNTATVFPLALLILCDSRRTASLANPRQQKQRLDICTCTDNFTSTLLLLPTPEPS